MRYPRRIPSLVDLCVQTAIDNIRYMGDVGEVDLFLLKDILPHCNIDQLTHIENSTKGRDLSPVTDDLWKRFYEQQFGEESANTVIKRMKQKRVVYKWKLLYEAKMKEREEAQNKIAEKLKQSYAESQAKKQSRQIQICSKVPPSSSKRGFWGGNGPSSSLSNVKGNLMKKAKLEYVNSHEAKVHAMMRRNASQRNNMQQSVPRSTKPINFPSSKTASSSKNEKPVARR
ncbi:transcription elongation factor B polypeptide 3 [Canna indica]|uniref:Transcription elongation factor B polypeptide 3 n=1 Tax=Canna indica TaxID=4628 RepID=A0AAQ3KYS0_9LILI|nr:transcription elongation factor B polypeptide 3 [Canna indica]